MASLQMLIDEKFSDNAARAPAPEKDKMFKLKADPSVTVAQIALGLSSYLKFCGTTCLWTCLCPPSSGPLNYGWKTPPHGPWISKKIHLLFEMVGIAPNTKLLQQKVQKAMRILYAQKEMTLPEGRRLDDMLDKMDLALRVLLSMLRQLKVADAQQTMFPSWATMLSDKEMFALKCVLAKIKLQFEAYGKCDDADEEEDGNGTDDTPEPMPLALIEHIEQAKASGASASDPGGCTGSIFYDVTQKIMQRYDDVGQKQKQAQSPRTPVMAPGSPLVPRSNYRRRRSFSSSSSRTATWKGCSSFDSLSMTEEVQKKALLQDDDLLADANSFKLADVSPKAKAKAKPKRKTKAKAKAKAKVDAGVGASTTAKDVACCVIDRVW